MVRLRKQARHCDFGTSLNDNLGDQLIEKLTDFELKRKLLEQRNVTLEEALDKARAWEATNNNKPSACRRTQYQCGYGAEANDE